MHGREKRIRSYDLFAAVAFACLLCGFLYMAHTGIGVPDESFYVTIPHRLMQGDRLIIDDWHVSQFSSFMQYLPVKLYYEHNGSFDGIILYLRYFYIVCQMLTLAVIYPFFRKYGWKGAAAWAIFGAYVPIMLFSLNYYTLCLWPAVIVCSALFLGKTEKAPVLVLLGVLTALAVLAEPMIGIAYFIYTLFVLTRQMLYRKKPDFLKDELYFVNVKVWGFLTVGILITAAAFLVFLFRGGDPLETIKAIPHLFNGVEYDFSAGGNVVTLKVAKRALELYGAVPAVLLAVLTAASVCLQKFRKTVRPFIAAGLAFCLIYAFVHAAWIAVRMRHYDYYILFPGVPLYLCGPAAYFLLDKKDVRLRNLWCAGALLSVLLDISSAVILGVCGMISAAASFICLAGLVPESINDVREAKKTGRKKTVLQILSAAAAVLCLAAVIGNEALFNVCRLNFNATECMFSLDFTKGRCDMLLEEGAYAGIRTTKTIAAKYNAMHDDMALIKDKTEGPVLIYDRFAYLYLYLDKPYATFSAWHVDWTENDRLLQYYEEFPEKRPDYIFVPEYDPYSFCKDREISDKLEWLQSVFDCTVTEGTGGYILERNR